MAHVDGMFSLNAFFSRDVEFAKGPDRLEETLTGFCVVASENGCGGFYVFSVDDVRAQIEFSTKNPKACRSAVDFARAILDPQPVSDIMLPLIEGSPVLVRPNGPRFLT